MFQPSKTASISIDAYKIDIDKRILYSGNLALPANLQALLAQQGVLVGAARYFTNALDTGTTGVDIVGSFQWPLAGGDKLGVTVGYNHNSTDVDRVAANPAVLAQNNLVLVDRQTILRATDTTPRDKLVLTSDYSTGPWALHGAVTRYRQRAGAAEQRHAGPDAGRALGGGCLGELSAGQVQRQLRHRQPV